MRQFGRSQVFGKLGNQEIGGEGQRDFLRILRLDAITTIDDHVHIDPRDGGTEEDPRGSFRHRHGLDETQIEEA